MLAIHLFPWVPPWYPPSVLLMDLPSALGPWSLDPVMVLFFSIALYGLALVIIDRISARLRKEGGSSGRGVGYAPAVEDRYRDFD